MSVLGVSDSDQFGCRLVPCNQHRCFLAALQSHLQTDGRINNVNTNQLGLVQPFTDIIIINTVLSTMLAGLAAWQDTVSDTL